MRAVLGMLILVSAAACSEPVEPTTQAAEVFFIKPLEGNHQSAYVSSTLAQRLSVRVVNQHQKPLSGVVVKWSTSSGAVEPPNSVTDVNGVASARWQLGKESGAVTATATAGSAAPIIFTADALPAPPAFSISVTAPMTVKGTRLATGELECTYDMTARSHGGAPQDFGLWRWSTSQWTRSDGTTRTTHHGDPTQWFGTSTIGVNAVQVGTRTDRWDAPFTVTHFLTYYYNSRDPKAVQLTVICSE